MPADALLSKNLYDAITAIVTSAIPPVPVAPDAERWLTTTQAAAYLGMKPTTLEIYRHRGCGPKYHKPTKNVVRYSLSELDRYLGREIQSTSEPPRKQRRKS